MNIQWSRQILTEISRTGALEFIVCAGARNSPLVAVLSKTEGVAVESFFEERCASFFALGAARRGHCPAVVITTSGTAVAELLAATIEAFHTGVPLILLTADRPRRLRGTGAPQAIDQFGLFEKFVEMQFDLENGESISLEKWSRRAPIHINVCLDEPLLDEPISPFQLMPLRLPEFQGTSFSPLTSPSEWGAMRVAKFLRGPGTLLNLVGTLETSREREAVVDLLLRLNAPVYLEATSGLREDSRLVHLALRAGDRLLAWALKKGLLNRVLRIGGVPTVRIWRDLEEPTSTVDVLSLTPLPFAGLSRGEMICANVAEVALGALKELSLRQDIPHRGEGAMALMTKDKETSAKLHALIKAEPLSEPSLVHALSITLKSADLVYVGNSLPIREWDLAATYDLTSPRAIEANRGVNGIDGQVSTFLGLVQPQTESWCILGDLTALYDLAAPWALAHRAGARVRIVVINNGGGKIFSRIFSNALFENRHTLGFESWAKMWSLHFERWTQVPSHAQVAADIADIVELVPDEAATARFWSQYDQWWV